MPWRRASTISADSRRVRRSRVPVSSWAVSRRSSSTRRPTARMSSWRSIAAMISRAIPSQPFHVGTARRAVCGLEAGGDENMLKAGDKIRITQSAVVLEKLISQFSSTRQPNRRLHIDIAGKSMTQSTGRAGLPGRRSWRCPDRWRLCKHQPESGRPFEPYNRAMFGFNETVDKAAIKPLAQGYDAVTPLPVRTGVGNFSVTSATSGSASTICCKASRVMRSMMRAGCSSIPRSVSLAYSISHPNWASKSTMRISVRRSVSGGRRWRLFRRPLLRSADSAGRRSAAHRFGWRRRVGDR